MITHIVLMALTSNDLFPLHETTQVTKDALVTKPYPGLVYLFLWRVSSIEHLVFLLPFKDPVKHHDILLHLRF